MGGVEQRMPEALWSPAPAFVKTTNLYSMMQELHCDSYTQLHSWSVKNRRLFWEWMLRRLNINFQTPPSRFVDNDKNLESPAWFPGAKLNIAESCFQAPATDTAIIYSGKNGIERLTFGQLRHLSNRVANSLLALGLKRGDAIGIDMLMTAESVAIYLGAVMAGMPVIGIADSFAPQEIATRLRLGDAKLVFTQDVIWRGEKRLPMYEKVQEATQLRTIVIPAALHDGDKLELPLRANDISWKDFLVDGADFKPVGCDPAEASNILFSSGTTGDPKAIPWSHTTPIKCAADAWLHHNIQPNDVLAWPTSLGWMMGPWLIYAALVNRASMALFYGLPGSGEFGKFVAAAKVTMLGVVPSLVKTWKQSGCMESCDWSAIKCFSSTGECSNAGDMAYLMKLAGNKPVIEYCGGTEIGGGYITGTMVQPCIPSTFSTPAMGLDYVILDEAGKQSDNGELLIVPPSIGLSLTLLNKDHHEVYYEDTPKGPNGELLRRHGDQMERLENGYWRAHGRVDDTMNLGGIKVSSAEIEKVLNLVAGISETAAIAVSPKGGGPSLLVIYAVLKPGTAQSREALMPLLQTALRKELNPLFKIHDLVFVETLPRTASNKVMRRILRGQYKHA